MKKRTVTLLLVYVTVFIDSFALSMVVPLLAFLGREFEATPPEVSYLFGGFAIAQFISALLGGRLSDKFGRRPFLLLSLVGSSFGTLAQGLAPSYAAFLIARVATGLLGGSFSVANGVVTDIIPPAERPKYLAFVGACLAGAFVIGPTASALLSAIGLRTPLYVAAGASFVALNLAIFKLHETNRAVLDRRRKQPAQRSADERKGSATETGIRSLSPPCEPTAATGSMRLGEALGDEQSAATSASSEDDGDLAWSAPTSSSSGTEQELAGKKRASRRTVVLVLLAASLQFSIMFSQVSVMTIFALLVDCRYQWTADEVGYVLAIAGVIIIFVQVVGFNFLRRVLGQTARVALLGLGLSVAGQAIMASGDRVAVLLTGVYMLFCGSGLVMPSVSAMISNIAPSHQQATFIAVGVAALFGAQSIAPFVSGELYIEDLEAQPVQCDPTNNFLVAIGVLSAALCSSIALIVLVKDPIADNDDHDHE